MNNNVSVYKNKFFCYLIDYATWFIMTCEDLCCISCVLER